MRTKTLALPQEKQRIVDALLDQIEACYSDHIAIVACYGSYITNTQHLLSDVDFYFIPIDGQGYAMSSQFIIDSIGYDLWPLPWERVARIAALVDPISSFLAEAHVVYYRDLAALDQFENYQRQLQAAFSPPQQETLVRRTGQLIADAKALFFDMNPVSCSLAKIKQISIQIIETLLTAEAYMNSTYVRKGAAQLSWELSRLEHVHEHFEEIAERMMVSMDPLEIHDETSKLILLVEQDVSASASVIDPHDQFPTRNSLQGCYEEMKSIYNKLIITCDEQDKAKAAYIIYMINRDVESIFRAHASKFPDLNEALSVSFDHLQALAEAHEGTMLRILREYEVSIRRYPNVEQFVCTKKPCP